ncbi:MAG: hypothetical protein ACTHLE_07255 [Agriterribacter sp.]
MKYTSFTVKPSKKTKGNYIVESTSTRVDSMGTWETSMTFGELVPIDGYLILIKFIVKPVAVFKSLDEFCSRIRAEYDIMPCIEDGCKSCSNNKPGVDAGQYCINNCIGGNKYRRKS